MDEIFDSASQAPVLGRMVPNNKPRLKWNERLSRLELNWQCKPHNCENEIKT
jgi:hypothetical protein